MLRKRLARPKDWMPRTPQRKAARLRGPPGLKGFVPTAQHAHDCRPLDTAVPVVVILLVFVITASLPPLLKIPWALAPVDVVKIVPLFVIVGLAPPWFKIPWPFCPVVEIPPSLRTVWLVTAWLRLFITTPSTSLPVTAIVSPVWMVPVSLDAGSVWEVVSVVPLGTVKSAA